jgi:hypothetical protein
MIQVRLEQVFFDHEQQTAARRTLAVLRAEGKGIEVDGDRDAIDFDRLLLDPFGDEVRCEADPERWLRCLAISPMGPDLAVEVLEDTDPLEFPSDWGETVTMPDISLPTTARA